jgi:hypothetical protein
MNVKEEGMLVAGMVYVHDEHEVAEQHTQGNPLRNMR